MYYMPDYTYGMAGAYIVWCVICLGISALVLVGMAKVFDKAGEHWWAIFIPFYNNYVLYKISMGDGWKFLWLLVPFVNIYFAIKVYFDLAKSFGLDIGYGFGLLFLPEIFFPIIGLGQANYCGPVES